MDMNDVKIRRFISTEIPSIIKQLTRIADALYMYETPHITAPSGKFEEITKDELKKLESDMNEFDKFFEKMTENFDLKNHFPHQIESVKNIVRHAYNANKS